MTSTSEKYNSRQIADTKIETLHDKPPMKVFKVTIKQGRFIVIDYKNRFDKKPDTEVFWESGAIPILPHAPEYKLVDKIITSHIKSITP